jgi:hypothetical protein
MAGRASVGSESHGTSLVNRPSARPVQLSTLYVGSNIHHHASVLSAVGMTNGSKMAPRISFSKRVMRSSRSASTKPSTALSATAPIV